MRLVNSLIKLAGSSTLHFQIWATASPLSETFILMIELPPTTDTIFPNSKILELNKRYLSHF
jgi:hypothetical protein